MSMNFEQVKAAKTPDEMRAELERLSHYDPLVRNVFDMARYRGMSGEDKYTVLAFESMRIVQTMKQHMLHDVRLTATPKFASQEP